ncbi:MAG: hypothetical protein R3190_12580 [Thermoanaerobaculia bacterium]|nr:hypothetical protein [Thermoanaerobaculia bacterium]
MLFALGSAAGTAAQEVPCLPCAAVHTEAPREVAAALALPQDGDARPAFLVKWEASLADLDGAASAAAALSAAGAIPVVSIATTVPAPALANVARLDDELEQLANLARRLGDDALVQVRWAPATGAWTAADYAFVLKRAAVAVTGAAPGARVMTAALPPVLATLRGLWSEEIAAYIDLIALEPADHATLAAAVELLAELDPGRQVLVDAVAAPPEPAAAIVPGARVAAAGASGAFVRLAATADPEALAALTRLAVELSGDVSLDRVTVPADAEAWTFVRGDDSSLRVVLPAFSDERTLTFPDRFLARPVLLGATADQDRSVAMRRREDRLEVTVGTVAGAAILRLERMSAAEIEGLEGLEDQLTVAGERQMPVEEILSRLQAFEDDQSRRIRHYQATNTSHLRFQLQSTATLETTFRGPFFFERGKGYDWAWEEFLINGVRWRSQRIPRIPLIQPERAAAQPLEIHFTPDPLRFN